jgi:hypothetical protein
MGNPPRPPFFKGGGNVLLFSETCRHAILCGIRSENSLGISPSFRKGQNISPPFCKGGRGDLTIGQRKPRISPPFTKGGRGGFSKPASNGRNGSGDGEALSGRGGEGGDVENINPPRPPFFTRKCTSNILISLHAFSSCFVTGLRHVGFMGNPPRPPFFKGGECSAVFGNLPTCDPLRHTIRK